MNKRQTKKRKTVWSWLRRSVLGASKEYASEKEAEQIARASAINDVEEIVSPGKQIARGFFERKLAVVALCIVIAMFLIVFIGPLFMPKYYDSYTEITQKSVPPNFRMLSVPKELKNDIKMIDSYGSFTVGLSNAGKVYVWGATKIGTTGIDVKHIPDQVLNTKIAMVAAGIDHIIAIGEDGIVYGWGNNRFGQYAVTGDMLDNPNIITLPEALTTGELEVDKIKKLTCGFQCSAILMDDGTLYIWGNRNAYANLDKFIDNNNLKDIGFTLNYVLGVPEKGNSVFTGTRGLFDQVRSNIRGKAVKMTEYLDGRTIESITTTTQNFCLQLSDRSVCFAGDFALDSTLMPELSEGESLM